MKLPDHLEPLLLNGKPAKYGDVKTWRFVKAWRNTKLSGENALIAEVKCSECDAETLFTAKSMRSCTAAACVHDPYAPVGLDAYGKKALPVKALYTWQVLSYVPGSKKVKSLYNCVCNQCGKEVQFVSGDFRPDRLGECNHDLDVKQGVGSDHAWWSRNPLPDDKKGWHIIEMHSQKDGKQATFECKCLTCEKIAFFNTYNYRNNAIPECNHSADRIYGIGSDPTERIRKYPKETTNHKYYNMWKGMRGRTCNPNSEDYKDYGGRGIELFEDWKDPTVFLKWLDENLGDKPDPTWSINRIDNDGNYEPGNIEWASPEIQAGNKRNVTIFKDKEGIEYNIEELIQIYGYSRYHWSRALLKHPIVDNALEYIKSQKV